MSGRLVLLQSEPATLAGLLGDWSAYLDEMVASGELASSTASTYKRGVERFLQCVGTASAVSIRAEDVRAWRAEMLLAGANPSSVDTHMAGVRALWRWAVATERLPGDPTRAIRSRGRGGARRHVRQPLSDAEMRSLLQQPAGDDAISRRDRALVHLLAYTGIRSVEAYRARLRDLQLDAGRLRVTGKGHRSADEVVYVRRHELMTCLQEWLAVHPGTDDPGAPLFCGLGPRNQGGPLSLRSIRRIVRGCLDAAGVTGQGKTTHSLRHTVVTNLLRHGVSPERVMSVTRHRSLDTLQIYVHDLERESDPPEGYVSYDAQSEGENEQA